MASSFRGVFVDLPREGGATRGLHFEPARAATTVVLMLPGSGGGLGPGLDRAPRPFADAPKRHGRNGIYLRLAHELSTGAGAALKRVASSPQLRRGSSVSLKRVSRQARSIPGRTRRAAPMRQGAALLH